MNCSSLPNGRPWVCSLAKNRKWNSYYLPTYLLTYLSIYLSIYLFIYLSFRLLVVNHFMFQVYHPFVNCFNQTGQLV